MRALYNSGQTAMKDQVWHIVTRIEFDSVSNFRIWMLRAHTILHFFLTKISPRISKAIAEDKKTEKGFYCSFSALEGSRKELWISLFSPARLWLRRRVGGQVVYHIQTLLAVIWVPKKFKKLFQCGKENRPKFTRS